MYVQVHWEWEQLRLDPWVSFIAVYYYAEHAYYLYGTPYITRQARAGLTSTRSSKERRRELEREVGFASCIFHFVPGHGHGLIDRNGIDID